ncbi:MAG: M13 family metallopeptidase [Verrucomicrobiales bacterium]|nr:M13 family metallopeptidase [Verrucomicrobiales bacterium]
MKPLPILPALAAILSTAGSLVPLSLPAATTPEPAPRFSVAHLDPSTSPRTNFFQFANGTWVKNNPVPADKSRWASFDELAQRNWTLVRALLENAAAPDSAPAGTPQRQVGDFYASALDTNRLESLRLAPIQPELKAIAALRDATDGARLVGDWHRRGLSAGFGLRVGPDARDSGTYALYLTQGGLGLPDRDYYLTEGFASQRTAYLQHLAAQLQLLGQDATTARTDAEAILALETALAKSSRSRTELRDQEKNYHRHTPTELKTLAPNLDWDAYFAAAGIREPAFVVVGQPEFFATLSRLTPEQDPLHWMAYLRWHLIRNTSPYVHAAAADENFRFYGTVLQGQPQPEPLWQRAARVIDGGFSGAGLGEALGQMFVEKHFPPQARERMSQMVALLREVFQERLARLPWMSETTRAEARRKFDRFTPKIGHPDKFRDYSRVAIRRDDFLGNVQRAATANFERNAGRIGQPVDRSEWGMTPQTVNAYFSPTQNEIVFPAGILQPPFFDLALDDAVNFGAIGSVIGHEISHGYDDQGRKYDAAGNLRDWWTAQDAAEFDRRAAKLVDQFNAYEPLPGTRVNGRLTLGENLADVAGVSIAYEALQRFLQRNPQRRQNVDGFTPEQRFFLGFAQAWRVNTREAELRRRLVVDSHAPPQFRAFGPLVNLAEFHAAFGIQPGDPMFKAPEDRAQIW